MKQVLITQGSWAREIARKLRSLGARTCVLAPTQDADALYDVCSHILIPGGADIHPQYYGEDVTWARPYARERDRVEIPLVQRALSDGKPVMGICRGHQVITVAAGGSLYQDITHDLDIVHDANVHRVRVAPWSRLSTWLGRSGRYSVNSFHHQAVRRVPTGWRVAAESFTGVAEAIEHPHLPVISVQWHPEQLSDPASHNLFVKFLEF